MPQRYDQFYLVREDMLTEAMKKTLEAKALLESGKAKKINEAVQAVGLSRSAFYKYKEGIYPFKTMVNEKIVTLSINLVDRSGTLSQLLALVALSGSNVLTINQTIPLKGRANITLSVDTEPMNCSIGELMKKITDLDAVEKVEIVGSGF